MKRKRFNELLASVREAGAVMRGEREAHREVRLEPCDVKTMRTKLPALSQPRLGRHN